MIKLTTAVIKNKTRTTVLLTSPYFNYLFRSFLQHLHSSLNLLTNLFVSANLIPFLTQFALGDTFSSNIIFSFKYNQFNSQGKVIDYIKHTHAHTKHLDFIHPNFILLHVFYWGVIIRTHTIVFIILVYIFLHRVPFGKIRKISLSHLLCI